MTIIAVCVFTLKKSPTYRLAKDGAMTSQKRTDWPGSVRLTLFLSEVSPGLARKKEAPRKYL
ncbi:hypothetical protein [Acidithiobacillus sulfuriphilus]|uniref:hypothetical protein n=1 Tax=Acidithiobacillus sulfuriphilus TaxID=1867749 RepID=UPI003F5E3D11